MNTILVELVLPWVQLLVLTVLPILGTNFIGWLRNKQVSEVLVAGIERAGGEAYLKLKELGKGDKDPLAFDKAVVAGADYLSNRVGDAMRAKGVTYDGALQIVRAQLGTLLAADPNVKL